MSPSIHFRLLGSVRDLKRLVFSTPKTQLTRLVASVLVETPSSVEVILVTLNEVWTPFTIVKMFRPDIGDVDVERDVAAGQGGDVAASQQLASEPASVFIVLHMMSDV